MFERYDDPALETAGLVIAGDGGKRYDRFRDRIMFPIHDSRGQVIGFGGRVLGDGEPKYLNSPETPLFSKGRELYGLYLARNAIREAGAVVVVEGYMDVVALAQHGIDYAVATLGTATTPVHVQKLFRQSDRVIFCFDGDAAGRKAAWRALENALPVLADGKNAGSCSCPTARIRTTSCAGAARRRSRRWSSARCRPPSSCWPSCRAQHPPDLGRRARRAGDRGAALLRRAHGAGAGRAPAPPPRRSHRPAGGGIARASGTHPAEPESRPRPATEPAAPVAARRATGRRPPAGALRAAAGALARP